jgi:hypothetical protein
MRQKSDFFAAVGQSKANIVWQSLVYVQGEALRHILNTEVIGRRGDWSLRAC